MSIKNSFGNMFHNMTGFKFKKRNTQKPLNKMVPELLSFIQREQENRIIYNDKLFQVFNGNLLKFVEESLQTELSPRAFQRARGRIPPCNILKKVNDKISRVYDEPCERECQDETDEELMEFYSRELDLNSKMASANELLNLHKYCAIEPFLDGNTPSVRIIPAHQFLIYSDSKINPNEMTVFIKFMGSIRKDGVPVVDNQGRTIKTAEENAKNVALYYVYSDSEFMIMDHDGDILENKINPYNKIPFIFVSTSKFELMPTPDSDNLSMSVLIPKLLGDLNYSAQFASHSIMYGIDVDTTNLENNPDAFWCVSSVNKEGASPSIGTISPTVNISQVLELINAQMALWLDCKGVKVNSTGGATVQDAVSGVSKMIDSGDSSSLIKKQMSIFQDGELYFWELLKNMHNYWVSNSMLSESLPAFTDNFNPSIKFGELKVIPSRKEMLDEIKTELDIGVTTIKRAIAKLYPNLTQEQVEVVYKEIQEEKSGKYSINLSDVNNTVNDIVDSEDDSEDESEVE